MLKKILILSLMALLSVAVNCQVISSDEGSGSIEENTSTKKYLKSKYTRLELDAIALSQGSSKDGFVNERLNNWGQSKIYPSTAKTPNQSILEQRPRIFFHQKTSPPQNPTPHHQPNHPIHQKLQTTTTKTYHIINQYYTP
jgi:hypothetical protein